MNLLDFLFIIVALFGLGLFGAICTKKNVIKILLSLELMLLAVNLNFILFSTVNDDIVGQVFSLLILVVAAAEAALGLAIIFNYFRSNETCVIEFYHVMSAWARESERKNLLRDRKEKRKLLKERLKLEE